MPTLNISATTTALKTIIPKLIPRTRRGGLVLGISLLLVALIGIAYVYQSQKGAAATSQYQQYYQQALDDYNQAQSLKELDTAGAQKALDSARQHLDQALSIKPQSSEALSLKQQLESNIDDILKIYQVDQPALWLDLDLVKKNFFAKTLSHSLGKLLILDPSQKTLITVDIAKKSNQLLAGQEKLGDAKLSALNGEIAMVFSSDKGLLKVEKDVSVVVKTDDQWGSVADLYVFGGNVYLLDKAKSAIWKYLPIANGYSDRRNYFYSGTRADLGSALRMQIDGSVWVLRGDGQILKFTQGATDFFSYSGLDKPIKDPKSFYVSDTTDKLYLLDNGNSRLVVFDKKGVYHSQYRSDQLTNFTDLMVDEQSKKVYLLAGSRIFQLDLR